MDITNTYSSYGLISILLHWLMAILITGLFFLGLYMVELDYYSPWYVTAPQWHKVIGIVVFVLLLIRFIWREINVKPTPLVNYKQWEISIARLVHRSFYLTILIVCVSGYFITTGKGAGIDMFGLFSIPAITNLNQDNIDRFGEIHKIVAWIICILFFLHVLATMKHQFIDKDITLKRILFPSNTKQD